MLGTLSQTSNRKTIRRHFGKKELLALRWLSLGESSPRLPRWISKRTTSWQIHPRTSFRGGKNARQGTEERRDSSSYQRKQVGQSPENLLVVTQNQHKRLETELAHLYMRECFGNKENPKKELRTRFAELLKRIDLEIT